MAVIFSGDGDYVPTVKDLQRRGIKVRVIFWTHATSRELRQIADEFVALDEHLDFLAR